MSDPGGLSRWGALGLAAAIAAAAVPAYAFAVGAAPSLAKLERGRWLLRNVDEKGERAVCVAAAATLVQIEHDGKDCRHELVGAEANTATFQYTCPGRGFGRTQVRVEHSRLAAIETQGISNGRPFSYRMEARKIGAC